MANKEINDKLAELLNKLNTVCNDITEIKNEQTQIKSSLASIKNVATTVNENKTDINQLKADNKILTEKVNKLEASVTTLTQEKLMNSVKIVNIPFVEGENLTVIVSKICHIIQFMLEDNMIRKCFRFFSGKDKPSKNILLEFTSVEVKEMFLEAAKTKRESMTWGSLEPKCTPEEAPTRFFIYESMSSLNSALFSRAKEIQKSGELKYVWFRRGRVFVRSKDGAPAKKILCENDLNALPKEDEEVVYETDSAEFESSPEVLRGSQAGSSGIVKAKRKRRKKKST